MLAKGRLIIISSPSGGGKDAVINALLKIFPNSARLVTTTSRPPRPGNKEGADYFFISKNEFEEKIKQDAFVEHNIYSENYYGVEKARLDESLKKHNLIFTQIEVNGKHNLDKRGIKHLSIYLLPENLDILRARIERRGGLNQAQIDERLEVAKREIAASADYDHRIVNAQGKLDETVQKVAEIIARNAGIDKKPALY
ncbi:MAG: guanylate kinase [Candidatus Magasanikbacteria bacterium]|nr:guanylate kinase [Candidatus Magasanikbacteria bacterium]